MDTSNKNDKAKTIATIDINLQWPKINKQAWLDEVLEEHFHCVLCGTSLTFKHQTDFVAQTVVEEAHCPTCHIRNRQADYKLQ